MASPIFSPALFLAALLVDAEFRSWLQEIHPEWIQAFATAREKRCLSRIDALCQRFILEASQPLQQEIADRLSRGRWQTIPTPPPASR